MIDKLRKLNQLMAKLGLKNIQLTTGTSSFPNQGLSKTLDVVRSGESWEAKDEVLITYEANASCLIYIISPDTYFKVWKQSDYGDIESRFHGQKEIDTGFGVVLIDTVNRLTGERGRLGEIEMTEEFLDVAIKLLENKCLTVIKAEILEKLARKQLEEEVYRSNV